MDDEDNEIEDEDMINEKSNSQSVNKDNKEKLSTPNLQPKAPGTKQRRRSKNDCYGRDYVCGCGKTYLSYPALYTHIKTKHNGKTPEGTNANQVQSGRGRGRPRKNFLVNDDQLARKKRESSRQEVSLEDRNPEIKDFLLRNNINSDQFKENEDNYFRIYESFGLLSPNSDDENEDYDDEEFSDDDDDNNNNNEYHRNDIKMKDYKNNASVNCNGKNKNEKHVNKIEKTTVKEKTILFPINEAMDNQGYEVLRLQVEHLSNKTMAVNNNNKNGYKDNKDNNKENIPITCDIAIASFLIEISEEVIVEFYTMIIILLKHYRDCMNKLGWEILAQHKYIHHEQSGQEYCSVKDPSRFPEIANDFLNEYLSIHLPKFDKYFAVVIISHFNFWLYKNNHTIINLKLKNAD